MRCKLKTTGQIALLNKRPPSAEGGALDREPEPGVVLWPLGLAL